MADKKTRAVFGLYVAVLAEHGFRHWRATVVTVGPNQWELDCAAAGTLRETLPHAEAIRNLSDSDGTFRRTGLKLDHLMVNSQGQDMDMPRRLYAFETEYRDLYSVGLREATEMAKTLTTIDRRLEKLRDRFGVPATWGAYLARVAEAIGATRIVTPREPGQVRRYADGQPRIQTIGDGVHTVDYAIAQWVNPEPVEAEQQTA